MKDPEAFYREVDRMILEGANTAQIADHFNVRDRYIRRRRASLRDAGHRIPNAQGIMPGVNHDDRRV